MRTYVPVLKSVAENELWIENMAKADGGDYIAYLSAKVCLEQADAYYVSPAFNGSSTARDQVGYIINKALPLVGGDIESQIKEELAELLNQNDKSKTEIAIEIMLWIMRRQMFIDGNKRIAATLFIYILLHTKPRSQP